MAGRQRVHDDMYNMYMYMLYTHMCMYMCNMYMYMLYVCMQHVQL